MRAIVAEACGGYQKLKRADIPKPAVSDGRVLVRMTAAGVTPLDHTILSGGHPRAKGPLVLGGRGAAGVGEGGGPSFPVGSRVMFAGPYGVSENGAYGEWLAVRKENLCLIPDNIRGADKRACIIDLNGVTFIDKSGERLLRAMSKKGAQLIAEGLYIKHVLEQLKNSCRLRTAKVE